MPITNVTQGAGVVITHPDLVNIYGCSIGDGSRVGPFVEIQRGVALARAARSRPIPFSVKVSPSRTRSSSATA